MKFDYTRINKNLQALTINNKANFTCMTIGKKTNLCAFEDYAQYFGVPITEILFGEIKPKYKKMNVTIDGESKTFFIPIDKFEDYMLVLEEISV